MFVRTQIRVLLEQLELWAVQPFLHLQPFCFAFFFFFGAGFLVAQAGQLPKAEITGLGYHAQQLTSFLLHCLCGSNGKGPKN